MTCPITSIPNPLNPQELYLFFLAGKGKYTPGLEIHSYASGSHAVTGFVDHGITAPAAGTNSILNLGAFTSVVWNSMLNVYAMVRDPEFVLAEGAESTATDPKRLAQISPFFNIIGDKQVASVRGLGLASIVDGKGQAWMYAFTTPSLPSQPYNIKAIKLKFVGSEAPSTLTPKYAPASNSQLAAVYHPEEDKTMVFYQDGKQGSIRMIVVNGDESELSNTKDSRAGTGIAVVSIKTASGTMLALYYFAEKGGNTQRIVRNEKGKWGKSSSLDDGENPVESAETSYLTASVMGDKVVLFYVAKDKDGFFVQEDKIADF
ncbi:hypothetical protein F5Y17DRAFT_385093 [Xylariaceae sp. FL0594]|nr:hypothetical protein F5Y17DRAFT_385093 [Xylariaceae sp. FL0594]